MYTLYTYIHFVSRITSRVHKLCLQRCLSARRCCSELLFRTCGLLVIFNESGHLSGCDFVVSPISCKLWRLYCRNPQLFYPKGQLLSNNAKSRAIGPNLVGRGVVLTIKFVKWRVGGGRLVLTVKFAELG